MSKRNVTSFSVCRRKYDWTWRKLVMERAIHNLMGHSGLALFRLGDVFRLTDLEFFARAVGVLGVGTGDGLQSSVSPTQPQ